MKKNMKLMAATLALVMCAMTFSACGNKTTGAATSDGTSSNAEVKKGSIKLTYSYWGGNVELEAFDKLIRQFEKENPQYKINPIFTDGGSYATKMQTFFASNTAPDVMDVANDIIYDHVGQGMFEDLKPYMEKDNLLADTWNQGVLDAFTYGDQIIAAPQTSKPFAMVYNKKLFDEAGLDYPKAGWTENEFVELAKKLTKGEGLNKTYGMHFNWATSEFIRGLYKDHGFYNVDEKKVTIEGNEAFKHSIELISNLIAKDKVSPNANEEQAVGGGFETGKFAMAFTAPWDMPGFKDVIGDTFAWEVVPLPISEKYGQWQSALRADGKTISATSKNKDGAWELIKFFSVNTESQKALSEFGIPALTSYANSDEYKLGYPEGTIVEHDKSVFDDATNNSVGIQSTGIWGELNTVLYEEFQKIVLEGLSVDKALENVNDTCTKKLK